MRGKTNLQSNFRIMLDGLQKAIDEYLKIGYCIGEIENVEAYLVATIHALMDYADRFLEDDDDIMACRYINNTIKHVTGYVTHKEVVGGFVFPISYTFESEEIRVVWRNNADLECHHKDQKKAYIECFAGKVVLETLRPLAEKIERGIEDK